MEVNREEFELQEAIGAILPADVANAGGAIGSADGALFSSEQEVIAHAAPARMREFRAGRMYARAALRKLGCPDQPILSAPGRRPIWPAGFVGSISHSRALCGVIAARSDTYLGLGIDLEPATKLDEGLHALVGRPEERDALPFPIETFAGPADRGKLVFTIKEALFKAVYPLTLTWFGFQDAVIEFHPSASSFTAQLVGAIPQIPDHPFLKGRWVSVGSHVVAAIALPISADRGKATEQR